MSTDFLAGWDHEYEPEDYKELMNFQEYCGEQFVFQWSEVRDRIYEEARLYQSWEIVHPTVDYTVNQNRTNGCVSYGVSAGIEDTLCLAQQKRKEVELFLSCSPWLYGGYHNIIRGRPGKGGCSMSGMMRFIAQYGILPYDTQPKIYADGEVDWNHNAASWKRVFEKFGNMAVQYKIKVAKLPRNYDDIVACLQAGYAIPYGTDKKLVLNRQTGFYQLSGKTAHCMAWAGFGGDFTYNKNSWRDGRAKQRLVDVRTQVSSSYFDCFVVLDVERTRKGQADWSI